MHHGGQLGFVLRYDAGLGQGFKEAADWVQGMPDPTLPRGVAIAGDKPLGRRADWAPAIGARDDLCWYATVVLLLLPVSVSYQLVVLHGADNSNGKTDGFDIMTMGLQGVNAK